MTCRQKDSQGLFRGSIFYCEIDSLLLRLWNRRMNHNHHQIHRCFCLQDFLNGRKATHADKRKSFSSCFWTARVTWNYRIPIKQLPVQIPVQSKTVLDILSILPPKTLHWGRGSIGVLVCIHCCNHTQKRQETGCGRARRHGAKNSLYKSWCRHVGSSNKR